MKFLEMTLNEDIKENLALKEIIEEKATSIEKDIKNTEEAPDSKKRIPKMMTKFQSKI